MPRGRTLARSAGQLLIAGFDGTEPSKEILALIRAGLGGVILYRKNCVDALQVLELTSLLQEVGQAEHLRGVDAVLAVEDDAAEAGADQRENLFRGLGAVEPGDEKLSGGAGEGRAVC